MTAAPLPPSSSLHGNQVARAGLCYLFPGSRRTRERHPLDVGMIGQGLTHTRAISQHNIQHAFRKPNLLRNFTYKKVLSGVISEGFTTTVLPAARAGIMPHINKSKGKFQGKIKPQTP